MGDFYVKLKEAAIIEEDAQYRGCEKRVDHSKDVGSKAQVGDDRKNYAMEKAVQNGYDTFYEENTDLACKLYKHLHSLVFSRYYILPNDDQVALQEYDSESAARKAVRDSLSRSHNAANALFDKDDAACAVQDIVLFYTKELQRYYSSFKDILREFCEAERFGDELNMIEKIVGSCSAFLKKELYDELEDNSDYYKMYDLDFFVNQVDMTELDASIETNPFLSMLENIFAKTKTYDVSDIFDVYMEMEKDVNDKAASLHNAAGRKFDELAAGLAEVFGKLGNDLPPSEESETIADYLKRVMREDDGA